MKQVNAAANATKVDGVKLKNLDCTDQRLPPSKYCAGVYEMLSPEALARSQENQGQ